MAKMMRNITGGGCKCCNSWDDIAFRAREKREFQKEIRAIPLGIDPRYFDPSRP